MTLYGTVFALLAEGGTFPETGNKSINRKKE